MSVDGQRNSNARFVDERSSTQVASSQDRVSGTQPQLVQRAEPTRPGVLLSSKPPENTGIATVVDDLPHARVSEPPHPDHFSISAAPVTVTTAAPPSATVADDRSRPVSAAASHGLSVGREESRHQQPQPPPPPLPRASSPSGVPSAHSSLSLRAREPSTVRSYFRPEVSRPSEDDRHLDMHHLPPPPPPPPPAGDSYRLYDERSRWSPPPPPTYADRCGHYDRDRDRDRYWENNNNNNNNKGYRSPPPPRDRDRDRDRPYAPQPPPPPPPHWDHAGRTARYSEALYAPDRRITDDRDRSDNHERWYAPPPPPPVPASSLVGRPASFDNNNTSSSSSYIQRGGGGGALQRARSPSSPPPHKRARGEDE